MVIHDSEISTFETVHIHIYDINLPCQINIFIKLHHYLVTPKGECLTTIRSKRNGNLCCL